MDLSNCRIDDKGLAAILNAVNKAYSSSGNCCKLRVLKLWGNGFGAASSQLLHQLRQQKGVEDLVPDVTTYVIDGVVCAAVRQ